MEYLPEKVGISFLREIQAFGTCGVYLHEVVDSSI